MTNVPAQYQGYVDDAAAQLGIPASVVAAQIGLESGFNPNARSSAGAEGIAQFLPSTFRSYGTGSPFNVADAFHAYVNYMRSLLSDFHGDLRNALAAYNAGPGNIKAGMGYASKILNASGSGDVTVNGGSADTAGGVGGGDATQTGVWQQLGDFGSLFFTGGASLPLNGLIGGASNVGGAIGSLTNDVSVFIKMVSVLLKPSFWLRVASFFTGMIFLLVGTWFLVGAMRNK